MKLVSYLLCLLFFAPLLTGCFGNNEIEHDEALVGDWYIADEVVISFYSNGTVIGEEGKQGTWSTEDNRILDLEWNNSLSGYPHNSIFYTVNDGWLIALLPAGRNVEFTECDAVSKNNMSMDNWNTSIDSLENLAIEPKKGYPCDTLGHGVVVLGALGTS